MTAMAGQAVRDSHGRPWLAMTVDVFDLKSSR